MKYKLIESHWDPNTGISDALISCEYGTFIGHAYLHPEDEKYASRFLGCEIAERRAYLDALKVKMSYLDAKLDILIELESRFEDLRDAQFKSPEWKALNTLINVKLKEKVRLLDQMDAITASIDKSVAERIEHINKSK